MARYWIDDSLRGIVLLDEIEQHLHPTWQRHIVRLLHDAIPKDSVHWNLALSVVRIWVG